MRAGWWDSRGWRASGGERASEGGRASRGGRTREERVKEKKKDGGDEEMRESSKVDEKG